MNMTVTIVSCELTVGVKIKSEDGYTMLVIEEPTMTALLGVNYSRDKIAWKLRRSCRKSCSGNWAHSDTILAHVQTIKNRWATVNRTHFAFADEEDRLAAILKLGDKASIVGMWPSTLLFNVYTHTGK